MKKLITIMLIMISNICFSQTWPTQPVRVIVPSAVGSGPDLQARYIAERLKARWNQSVLVENVPGPSGLAGVSEFVKNKGSNHVLLHTFFSTVVSNDFLIKNMPYNYKTDLEPIIQISDVEMIWSVPANSKVMNMQDLINLSRTRDVFVAVTSKWVAQHTALELLNLQAGTNITPVLHKSAALAGTSLLSESVDVLIDTVSTSSGYAKSGRSRVIAVSTSRRSVQWPQVPTVGETLPGYVLAPWNAMFANKGMPKEIISQVNRDVNEILSDRTVPQTIFESVQGGTPEKLAQQIEKDRICFARLVKKFNLQPE